MDDYETLNKIGDGTFGTVYLCRRRAVKPEDDASSSYDTSSTSRQSQPNQQPQPQPQLVAVKKMKRRYYDWNDCMRLREVRVLKKLSHKNIIALKEVVRANNNLYLVFEYIENNLHQLIRAQSSPFAETTIKSIVGQIANGLAYVHRRGYFHRDIKPENLLCNHALGVVKIADFGLTREIDSQPPFTDYVSTRWYRAPELLLHSTNYSPSVDIWALGCVAGELYLLKPVFPGRSEIDQIFKICHVLGAPNSESWPEAQKMASVVQFNFPNIVPLSIDGVIKNTNDVGSKFLKSMLTWNPSDRLSAKDVLNHDYFKL